MILGSFRALDTKIGHTLSTQYPSNMSISVGIILHARRGDSRMVGN